MSFYIIKSSGEKELFSIAKFAKSLRKAGASRAIINSIAKDIESAPNLITTKDIYQYAYKRLLSINKSLASRYSLKESIYQLGPVGYPFEQYVAHIFSHLGYSVKTNQIIKGVCVPHEVDVVAAKSNRIAIIECKFRTITGEKINVKTPLYVKSRFDDINKKDNKYTEVWLVTNTQFTISSKMYARCANINLLGWGYPSNNGIERIIESLNLYPVTILAGLNTQQKLSLMSNGLFLCKEICNNREILIKSGLSQDLIEQVVKECEDIAKFKT